MPLVPNQITNVFGSSAFCKLAVNHVSLLCLGYILINIVDKI